MARDPNNGKGQAPLARTGFPTEKLLMGGLAAWARISGCVWSLHYQGFPVSLFHRESVLLFAIFTVPSLHHTCDPLNRPCIAHIFQEDAFPPRFDSMLLALPPELQSRIFSYLPTRQDVACSRLVSKQCHACSTPFLVPRVMISKRLASLQKAWRILQHPILSRHVTELVWDVSAYSLRIASDFENYIDACDESERDFRDQTSVDEDNAFVSFCTDIGIHCAPLPWQELNFKEMEEYEDDHMYAAGMHKGYDDYFRRYVYQTRIEKEGVQFGVLRAALCRARRIRRIVVADFTQVAASQEGYGALCNRLFGNTLEPEPIRLMDSNVVDEVVSVEVAAVKVMLKAETREDILISSRGSSC